ncbi:MAG: peptide chain release factor 1 [Clostridia bacterium]|nr:peptide chain release factor 1 [Clostridia bacterium]
MLTRLTQVDRRYEELTARLYDPTVTADPDRFRELLREQKQLEPVVLCYRRYKEACEQVAAMKDMLETESDSELRELAKEELAVQKALEASLEEELRVLLLPRDPRDDRSVIMEIRGGTGGEESALFAADLYRMYTMYAADHGFTTEVISRNETELGGVKEIVFSVAGQGAFSRLKYESGTHRVQRVPETESGGRIHTSAVTVAVLAEADEVEVTVDPSELKIDTFRSSGAGGQHINKTESAVRITHLPTGLVVECQDERSQHKNRDKAMRVLCARLLEREQEAQRAARAEDRRGQVGSGDRSERIRTYNFPQGRVTDHRIGLTLYKLDAVMNGALDELIDALLTADRAAKLQRETEHKG